MIFLRLQYADDVWISIAVNFKRDCYWYAKDVFAALGIDKFSFVMKKYVPKPLLRLKDVDPSSKLKTFVLSHDQLALLMKKLSRESEAFREWYEKVTDGSLRFWVHCPKFFEYNIENVLRMPAKFDLFPRMETENVDQAYIYTLPLILATMKEAYWNEKLENYRDQLYEVFL